MRTLRLERRGELGGGTIGHLLDGNKFLAYTLEPLWMENIAGRSCVPCGDYICELEHSARFQRELYELKDVPGRTECKFHVANYPHQLQGCIAVGLILGNDAMPLRSSTAALDRLHVTMHEREFRLEIRQADGFIPESHRLIGGLHSV